MSRYGVLWAFLAGLALAAGGGCTGASIGNGTQAEYTLTVVLERNLDLGTDYLWMRFLRNDSAIAGARVVVDGDTITAPDFLSGQRVKTYAAPRLARLIRVAAFDDSRAFVYRDSVVSPAPFTITNVIPANHIWRPRDQITARVEWSTSLNAYNYFLSLQPPAHGLGAPGFAAYADRSQALAQTFPKELFYTRYNALDTGLYNIRVIAYNPNFILRPQASYGGPPQNDVPAPILTDMIAGEISVLVVAPHDSIRVSVL